MCVRRLIKETYRFIITGIINTIIDFSVLNIGMLITGITSGFSLLIINTVSFSCAIINSYFINKNWTFQQKDEKQSSRFIPFLYVSIFSSFVNNTLLFLITSVPGSDLIIPPQILANAAKIAATLVSFLCNFLGYKFIVFRKKKRPYKRPQ